MEDFIFQLYVNENDVVHKIACRSLSDGTIIEGIDGRDFADAIIAINDKVELIRAPERATHEG